MNRENATPSAVAKKTQVAGHTERLCRKGTLLFIEGEPGHEMYFVKTGRIRMLKHEGETTVVAAVAGPGSVIGEMSLLHRDPRGYTAQVVEDSVVVPVDEETYQTTLRNIPSWLGGALQSLVKRLSDTLRQSSVEMTQKSVAGVVRVLMLLAENGRTGDSETPDVPLCMLKDALYGVTGLSDAEMEQIFLHLILKRMIRICRDGNGIECVNIAKPEVLHLYYSYLRARQRNEPFLGDNLPLSAFDLAGFLLTAEGLTRADDRNEFMTVAVSALEAEWQLKGKKLPIDPEALKAVAEQTHDTGSGAAIVVNRAKAQLLHRAGTWLPIFKEEVKI